MERCTDYDHSGVPYIKHRFLDEDGLPTVEYIYDQLSVNGNEAAKFALLEDLEEQDRLVVVDIPVGTTVYDVNLKRGIISRLYVESIWVGKDGNFYNWKMDDENGIYSNVRGFLASDIGKTVFLTREEAETALAGRMGERGGDGE